MRLRLRGSWAVALIIVFGLVSSIGEVCLRRLFPLPLAILSERDYTHAGDYASSVSPDGRLILFLRTEGPRPLSNESKIKIPVKQPFLLDLTTGEQLRLPFPAGIEPWDKPEFTADGTHIYFIEPRSVYNGRQWLLIYDIRNRVLRTVKIGPCECAVSDELGENLLVSTRDYNLHYGEKRIVVVPLADLSAEGGKKLESYIIKGHVRGISNKDRAIVLAEWPNPGYAAKLLLSVVDLPRGKTLEAILLGVSGSGGPSAAPFWTTDGRFLCYRDYAIQENRAAQLRNAIARRLPFVGRSRQPEEESIWQVRFWDSVNDRIIVARGSFSFAYLCGPGPGPSTVLIERGGVGFHDLIVLDVATGQEYKAPMPADSWGMGPAQGKYVLYGTTRAGAWVSVLAELAPSGRQ